MIVELAKSYGFCFGVKRAIRQAEKTKDAATIGPLIHNYDEINRLEKDFNVKTLNDISELKDETKAIIRTHGITKDDLETLKLSNRTIIDATCPFVKKTQDIVSKMSNDGYEIVIFGDANHPEVKSVKSYASTKTYVILNENELQEEKIGKKIALVSQTTKKVEQFLKIANYLILACKEVRVFNTICDATFKNQEAIRELSKKSDIMIVVGGKDSSNTKQLFLIAKENCTDSYLIENANEIESEWFKSKNKCGVGAGASTPNWIIENVIEKIKNLNTK